jgi:hypothetical protein
MSDSTLSGRSAALRKLNRLTKTKLPKGHGELPENFKYVWLVFTRRFLVHLSQQSRTCSSVNCPALNPRLKGGGKRYSLSLSWIRCFSNSCSMPCARLLKPGERRRDNYSEKY